VKTKINLELDITKKASLLYKERSFFAGKP